MARKTKKTETPEATLARWIDGSVPSHILHVGYSELVEMGWESGQVGSMEFDGMNYERFDLPSGEGYVVVEWDMEGNITVAQKMLERWER